MWQVLDFSWQLDTKWVWQLLLATLPGLLVTAFTQEPLWLNASFFAACTMLSYSALNNSKATTFAILILIYFLADILVFTLGRNWHYSLILLSSLAMVTGWLDNLHKNLRSLSSWLLIGCIYGGIKFSELGPDYERQIKILVLAMLGVFLAINLSTKPLLLLRLDLKSWEKAELILNFKYLMPVTSGVVIWHWFHVREPEWLLWSSLSVVYPELQATAFKFKQRFWGVVLGAGSGLLVIQFLSLYPFGSYCCFVLIILSLRMFKDYFPGFLLRCFLIVLYAGNQGTTVALIRLDNVIIGGLIGVFWTWLLLHVDYWYRAKFVSHTP